MLSDNAEHNGIELRSPYLTKVSDMFQRETTIVISCWCLCKLSHYGNKVSKKK